MLRVRGAARPDLAAGAVVPAEAEAEERVVLAQVDAAGAVEETADAFCAG